MRDAAQQAGVDRRTLHRWLHDDPHFAAAFNAWRRELLNSARARALAMTDTAMAAIHTAISKGDAYAALQLVRGLGVLKPPRPGPEDPRTVKRRRAVTSARRESRLQKAEQSYEVTRVKPLETPEEIDQAIADLHRLKMIFIENRERDWHWYDSTRDLTEEECSRRGWRKAPRPHDYPGEGWTPKVLGRYLDIDYQIPRPEPSPAPSSDPPPPADAVPAPPQDAPAGNAPDEPPPHVPGFDDDDF